MELKTVHRGAMPVRFQMFNSKRSDKMRVNYRMKNISKNTFSVFYRRFDLQNNGVEVKSARLTSGCTITLAGSCGK